MRWTNEGSARSTAFGAPDSQAIAFRLPGRLSQDRVHLLARNAFGYRAEVVRDNESWLVRRVPFHDAEVRARLAKSQRRQTQRLVRRNGQAKQNQNELRGGL